MKLIIDIPKKMVKALEQGSFGIKYNMYDLVDCVMNGTPIEQELKDNRIKNELDDEDYISRTEAIRGLGEEPYVWTDSDFEIQQLADWKQYKEMLENLPSVKQKSKTNELNKIKRYIKYIKNSGMGKRKSLEYIEKYIDGIKSE